MSEADYPFGPGVTVERRGLRDGVYTLVLDMLMSSDIEPGARLSIDGLARDLKVSQTPVREALVQLERTGLVTREALKGYRVAPPMTDAQVQELFDARIVLELGAVRLAAREATQVVPRLEAALAAHRTAADAVGRSAQQGPLSVAVLRDYFSADWAFHQVLFEATRNPFLLDMSESISTRAHRMRQTLSTGVSDAEHAIREHAVVMDAFRDGDADAAVEAMRLHLDQVRGRASADVE